MFSVFGPLEHSSPCNFDFNMTLDLPLVKTCGSFLYAMTQNDLPLPKEVTTVRPNIHGKGTINNL